MAESKTPEDQFALIVAPEGRTQLTLVRHLMLLFNYRYGLDLVMASSFYEGFSAVKKHAGQLICAAAILDRETDSRTSLSALNLEGRLPLFVVIPELFMGQYEELCRRMDDVWFVTWEEALAAHTPGSLRQTVERVFAQRSIGELFSKEVRALPFAEAKALVAHRIRNVKTLPTLPEVALRIMAMAEEPEGTVEDLEVVITSDPAIVHKLLQVINSPLFAGSGHKGGWSMHDAIVRLGRDQVGAIAQQINLMNSLVKPEDSLFDLRRFWEHSVACAVIADFLYREKLLRLRSDLQFNDYWIGALLHDVGKLILGFFFWEHFQDLITHMDAEGCTFREAERATGDVADHELLGRLLLMKSNVGKQLVEAVGTHHTVGAAPSDLVCVLHLADELSKELGFGYLEEEPRLYAAEVLGKLALETSDVIDLRDRLSRDLPDRIRALVDRCTTAPE
jgi:HD-like signal output (HDOD) protein